jgi:tripartite-type tricarboxylate transporter receptor subunit TctC
MTNPLNVKRNTIKTLTKSLTLAALAPIAHTAYSQSESWPSRPIKLIVPFAPGGNTDSIARITAEKLSKLIDQPFIVDNKAGANGVIAASYVAKAVSDGYTFLMAAMPIMAILPVITKTSYDPIKDFSPVSIVGTNPFVLGIGKHVPANNLKEFVQYVKSNPGKLNYASGGSGSVSHLSAVFFVNRAGLDMTHVSYKGGAPAVADLLGGQVEMYFGNISELTSHATAGNIKMIGVSSESRSSLIPNVPTIAESGYPGFKTITWNGIMAPTGTPISVISKVSTAIQEIVATPDMQSRLLQIGVDYLGNTPAQFKQILANDIRTWSDAAKASNLKVE